MLKSFLWSSYSPAHNSHVGNGGRGDSPTPLTPLTVRSTGSLHLHNTKSRRAFLKHKMPQVKLMLVKGGGREDDTVSEVYCIQTHFPRQRGSTRVAHSCTEPGCGPDSCKAGAALRSPLPRYHPLTLMRSPSISTARSRKSTPMVASVRSGKRPAQKR